jgi:hypothetical protein
MQNGIPDLGNFQIPKTEIDPSLLDEQQRMARYSKTAEFKKLKEHLEQRIAFYQTKLPNGSEINLLAANTQELGQQWIVSNAIIGEFKAIVAAYEMAAEAENAR